MNENIKNNEEKSPSMEQILQSIRGVISNQDNASDNKNGEVLELTEIVNEDGSISSLKDNPPSSSKPQDVAQNDDILHFIDNTLGIKEEETNNSNVNNQPNNVQETLSEPQQNDQNAGNLASSKGTDETIEEVIKNKSRLISDEAATASSEALKVLVKTVSKPISDGLAFRSGTTLEDLAIELIKPYLSQWLDNHLPNIVKNLVEKEIQKLIPKDDD